VYCVRAVYFYIKYITPCTTNFVDT
jgi:hypothetical protein